MLVDVVIAWMFAWVCGEGCEYNLPFDFVCPTTQANDDVFTKELAKKTMTTGLRMLLGAHGGPPVREGAIRGLHKYGHIDGVECVICK